MGTVAVVMEIHGSLVRSIQVLVATFAVCQFVGFGIWELAGTHEFKWARTLAEFRPFQPLLAWEFSFRLIPFRSSIWTSVWTFIPIVWLYARSRQIRWVIVLCLWLLAAATVFSLINPAPRLGAGADFEFGERLLMTLLIIISGLFFSVIFFAPLGLVFGLSERSGWVTLYSMVILATWALGHLLMWLAANLMGPAPESENANIAVSFKIGLVVWVAVTIAVSSIKKSWKRTS